MNRLLALLVLFFFSAFEMIGQTGSNPFEIDARLDSVYQNQNDIREVENIFEVREVQRKETSNTPQTRTVEANKEENTSDLMPALEYENEMGETEVGENPFDVSHVPIRKSKLKKSADAFKTKITEKDESKGSNVFLFYLSLFTGLLLAIVINTGRGVITKISKAITNENILKYNFREEQRGVNGHYMLLYIAFFINAAMFIYLVLTKTTDLWGWRIYLYCLIGIFAVYLARHSFLSLLAGIFPINKEVKLYSFTIESFNIFIGLILIPINLIIAFGPINIGTPLVYVTLIFVGIVLILRVFRGLLIGGKYVQGHLFHFLLYLCTFEILPVLLLLKVGLNYRM